MKISKVDHTSTGVGVANRESEGMLYNNPSKAGTNAKFSGDELEQKINRLNNKAKVLYNLFNEIKPNNGKDDKEDEEDKAKVENWKRISGSVKKFVDNLGNVEKQEQLRYIRNFPNEDIFVTVNKEKVCKKGRSLAIVNKGTKPDSVEFGLYIENPDNLIKEFANKSIRKAYQKTIVVNGKKIDVKEVVIKLVEAIVVRGTFGEKITNISDDELNSFLDVFDKDYNKTERLESVIKSLKNQDTKVQIKEKDGETLLAPAFSYNEKKKALFDFMILYASEDDEGRKKLRKQKKEFIKKYLKSGNSDGVVFSEKLEDALRAVACENDKELKKKLKKDAENIFRHELVARYQNREDVINVGDEQDEYWFRFFANEIEEWGINEIRKHNGLRRIEDERRFTLADIYEHLYKYFISFLASKYIDLGKGVYNFTSCDSKSVGELLPEFSDGISSFDYERISAEERAKRDMSTYVAFAVNNFANSVCESDVLSEVDDALAAKYNGEPIKYRDNAKKKVLRFFGGESNWGSLVDIDNTEFVHCFRENLATVRNSTVHFDAEFSERRIEDKQGIIRKMFNEEYDRLGSVYAKKYYSNNVPCFYGVEDIASLVGKTLYRKDRPIVAAVPAFSNIVAVSNISSFAEEWIGQNNIFKKKIFNNDLLIRYQSALYFLLKEIYYYGFLADDNLMRYLDKALLGIMPENPKSKEANPYRNFKARYKSIKESGKVSASDICERIMIDYSLQNNDIKEVLTSKNSAKGNNLEGFKHFRMLLYKLLRVAFIDYLNSVPGYAFLKNPGNREDAFKKLSEEEFATKFVINAYRSVKNASEDTELMAWYATAHFMNKKQINLLCGSIRTELKYLRDIDKRAFSTGNAVGKDTDSKISFYTKLLRLFEFTMNFCDVISNNVTDYFNDEEDYARKISVFVDYPLNGKAKDSLKAFCNKKVAGSKSGTVGIFYDGENPIIVRSVVRADMYGCDCLFESGIIGKVSFDDISEYYNLLPSAERIYANTGKRTHEEQKLIRKYQNIKNRVELTDVVNYAELINELYGQLLSWAYLRERDLIYMQMGYYYTKLYWGDSVSPEDPLNKFKEGEKFDINKGAVLYFIKALYSHDLKRPKVLRSSEGSFAAFFNYYSKNTYNAGLELFERDDKAHEEAIELRNYVAHFKYFSKIDRSIDEIYGDIFSGFFAYNINYHKSIPVVFKNILAQYKLMADIKAVESDSKPYSEKTEREYKNVKWVIKRDTEKKDENGSYTKKGLESDILTLKVKPYANNKGEMVSEIKLPAHDDLFLSNIRRIISYKA